MEKRWLLAQARRRVMRKRVPGAWKIAQERAARLHQFWMSEPTDLAAHRQPVVRGHRRVADEIVRLHAVLAAIVLEHMGSDTEIIHLRFVLPHELRADQEVSAREI